MWLAAGFDWRMLPSDDCTTIPSDMALNAARSRPVPTGAVVLEVPCCAI